MSFPDFTQGQPENQFPDFAFESNAPSTDPQDQNAFPKQDEAFIPFNIAQTTELHANNNTSPQFQDNSFPIDDEEQSRISQRAIEEEQRMQLIRKKMELELSLKNQAREKASQYITEFQR